MSDVLTLALEQIAALQRRVEELERQEYVGSAGNADTVDSIHASASATANKLLALNASSKLPASITGDADTVDSKHASAFAGISTWRVNTTTDETCTAQAYTDLANSDQSIDVLTGDIILAWWTAAWREDTARAISAAFKLLIGSTETRAFAQASAGANYVQNVNLVMQAVAASDATITVKAQCYVYTAGDSVEILDQEMHIMRIRAGGV